MTFIIFISAVTFALSFIFNDFFFRSFGLSEYVSLLFIPSGIRIFFVLVYGVYGVVGILLGSLLISLFYLDQSNFVVVVSTALVAAGAAWFAHWVSIKLLKLDLNLRNIKLMSLFQVSIIFSAISAISHQLLFIELGMSDDFTSGALSMFAGDMTGALLCLFGARYTVRLMRVRY
jgi:hypothetical protein